MVTVHNNKTPGSTGDHFDGHITVPVHGSGFILFNFPLSKLVIKASV